MLHHPHRHTLTATALLLAALPTMHGLAAADAPAPPAPADAAAVPVQPPAPPPPPPSPWTHKTKIGAFLTSITSEKRSTSRDATIAGAADSIIYVTMFEDFVGYKQDRHTAENRLKLRYGEQKVEGGDWTENVDEIDDEGVYRYALGGPHNLYGGWGARSVFTGAPPDEEPLDPFQARASAGYSYLAEGWQPDPAKDKFEARIGVRAQKTWGRGLSDDDRDVQTGLEGYLRYECQHDEHLKYFAQAEAFGEFEDMGHWQVLCQAGLSYKLTSALTAEWKLRAYYESEPDDAAPGATGYDEWSMRMESILGLVYEF